ncbi:MAG: hypothetical protein LUQ48_08320 [Methylococcaceae bacterium]|nr:hypothetical protein [Methylococcaceae bacterium]
MHNKGALIVANVTQQLRYLLRVDDHSAVLRFLRRNLFGDWLRRVITDEVMHNGIGKYRTDFRV